MRPAINPARISREVNHGLACSSRNSLENSNSRNYAPVLDGSLVTLKTSAIIPKSLGRCVQSGAHLLVPRLSVPAQKPRKQKVFIGEKETTVSLPSCTIKSKMGTQKRREVKGFCTSFRLMSSSSVPLLAWSCLGGHVSTQVWNHPRTAGWHPHHVNRHLKLKTLKIKFEKWKKGACAFRQATAPKLGASCQPCDSGAWTCLPQFILRFERATRDP